MAYITFQTTQHTTTVYNIPNFGGSSSHVPNQEEYFANLSSSEIVQILNAKEIELLAPVIGCLSLLMLIGLLVNLIVLYIYNMKFRKSNPRAFILCLAILDMLTCCIGIPYHIVDMLYPNMFYAVAGCQILTFILTFTSVASTLILVLIAVERFLKICKPYKSQISEMGSKIACWIVMAVALLLSWPSAIIYGNSTQDLGVRNVTKALCFIADDMKETIFPVLYESILFFVFFGGTITLLILYSIVGRRVLQHGKFRTDAVPPKQKDLEPNFFLCLICCTFTESTIDIEISFLDDHKEPTSAKFLPNDGDQPLEKDKDTISPPLNDNVQNLSLMGRIRAFIFTSDDSTLQRYKARKKCSLGSAVSTNLEKGRRTKRITIMLLLITAIYVISFLPHLTITIISALDEEFWENLSPAENALCEFFLRMYFINNVANFFIYGLWDAKFRKECKKLFGKMFKCI